MDKIFQGIITDAIVMIAVVMALIIPIAVLFNQKTALRRMINVIRVVLYPICFAMYEYHNLVVKFLKLRGTCEKIKKAEEYIIKYVLDIVLDKYIDKSVQKRRGFIFSVIIIVCMVGIPLMNNVVITMFTMVVFLLILAIFYHGAMNMLSNFIEEKAEKYIEIKSKKYGYEEIEKYMNLGKDLLPLNWIMMTSGWGLLTGIARTFCNEISVEWFVLGSALSLFVILSLIIMPNYILYSYSKYYLDVAKNSGREYFVQVNDEDVLLKEYNIVVK